MQIYVNCFINSKRGAALDNSSMSFLTAKRKLICQLVPAMTSGLTIHCLTMLDKCGDFFFFFSLRSNSGQNCINLLWFPGWSNLICKNTGSHRDQENVRNSLLKTNVSGQVMNLSPLKLPSASKAHRRLQQTALLTQSRRAPCFPVPVMIFTQTIRGSASPTIKIIPVFVTNRVHLIPHLESFKELSPFYR